MVRRGVELVFEIVLSVVIATAISHSFQSILNAVICFVFLFIDLYDFRPSICFVFLVPMLLLNNNNICIPLKRLVTTCVTHESSCLRHILHDILTKFGIYELHYSSDIRAKSNLCINIL